MNKPTVPLVIFCVVLLAALAAWGVRSAEQQNIATYEYATIRWAGRENTHLIRPSGNVEMLGPRLMRIKRQERVDERAFYLNTAMNALAKEGYELAAMTVDDIVMKRSVSATAGR